MTTPVGFTAVYLIQFVLTMYSSEFWICILLMFTTCGLFLATFLQHIREDLQNLSDSLNLRSNQKSGLKLRKEFCLIAEFYGDSRM